MKYGQIVEHHCSMHVQGCKRSGDLYSELGRWLEFFFSFFWGGKNAIRQHGPIFTFLLLQFKTLNFFHVYKLQI
jgi:hypothetical protein